jgi:hypothetical protein
MTVREYNYDQAQQIIQQLFWRGEYKNNKLRIYPTERLKYEGGGGCTIQFNATVDIIFRFCELLLKLVFKT